MRGVQTWRTQDDAAAGVYDGQATLNAIDEQIVEGHAAIYMSAVRQYLGGRHSPTISFICKLARHRRSSYEGGRNAISDLRASISRCFRPLVATKVRVYGRAFSSQNGTRNSASSIISILKTRLFTIYLSVMNTGILLTFYSDRCP